MSLDLILVGLAGVLTSAAPVLFAAVGETISERAGVINLSINGKILLCAMASFAVAVTTDSVVFGFMAGVAVGAAIAAVVAFTSITLRQNQVAVGFVLALMARDLAYFLGDSYVGMTGPRILSVPIPILRDIPLLGRLFFERDLLTYLSFVLIFVAWFWVFRTRPGLILRGIGERPEAAFVRGAPVHRLRYLYTILGGAIAGLAGPTYSLSVKAGWKGTISGLDGIGWIALAITIFGGWDPVRAALGAYMFALLQWLGLVLQPSLPGIPSQVLQVAPFPLMILTLLLVNVGNAEWVKRTMARLPDGVRPFVQRTLRSAQVTPPAALGTHFERE